MDKRDSFIEAIITLHGADNKVLEMALREHDKDCEFAAERIAPNLRGLTIAASECLMGMTVRSQCLARWVQMEAERLESGHWEDIAREVIKYAVAKASLAKS